METTRRADTDYGYIQDTIRHYYEESSKIVTRPVYMESKSRYNSRSVQEDINSSGGLNICSFDRKHFCIQEEKQYNKQIEAPY